MKSNEFTQQLVAFTGVEQQIATNKNLESLISSMSAQDMATAVGYLGSEITVKGNQGMLSNGSAKWTYNLATTADQVQLTVMNAQGATVYSGVGDPHAGSHSFNWDGKGFNGSVLPDGIYSLNVKAATADGTAVANTVYQKGVVTSIDTSSGQSQFSLNGLLVPRSSVVSVAIPGVKTN
jgi:flagellar basal-body rod modification protein FlgD